MVNFKYPFRGKHYRPRRARQSAGRALISWPGDFTYLGAFGINYAGLAGEHRFGRGLAFQSSRGNLLSTYGTGADAKGVYEFPVGTPVVGAGFDTAQYNFVNALKDYLRTPYTSAGGADLAGPSDLSGDNGLGYDPDEDVVTWAYSEGYGSNYGDIGYGVLDYAGATATGHGRYVTDDPQGFKSVSGGMVMIPQWYADAYLGGKRWAFGFGNNQSVVGQQDQTQGFSLVAVDKLTLTAGNSLVKLTDCATPGANSTTFTSATGGFTAGMVGDRLLGSFTGSNWTPGTWFITAVTDTNTVTLSSSPTPGGAGSGGTYWLAKVVPSTPLVGFWPTNGAPAAGSGRMDRPDGVPLAKVGLDGWGVDKWTWVDCVLGCCWIDTGTKHGVLFMGRYANDVARYLSSDVVSSYFRHFVGVYDPMRFAPSSGTPRYEIQADQLTEHQWPVVDYNAFGLGPAKAVTGIVSDGAKAGGDVDGCLVTSAGHGFIDSDRVRIKNASDDTYNDLWTVRGPTTDAFYLQNTSYGSWPGTTASGPGMTAQKVPSPTISGLGMAFDHGSNKLYVLHQTVNPFVAPSDQLQLMVMVYQLN